MYLSPTPRRRLKRACPVPTISLTYPSGASDLASQTHLEACCLGRIQAGSSKRVSTLCLRVTRPTARQCLLSSRLSAPNQLVYRANHDLLSEVTMWVCRLLFRVIAKRFSDAPTHGFLTNLQRGASWTRTRLLECLNLSRLARAITPSFRRTSHL